MLRDKGWTSMVDVVSLPNGAKLDKVVGADHEFLTSYNKVTICCDNDKPGELVAEDLARWLCSTADVKIVMLEPALGKDASDYYRAGYADKFFEHIAEAKLYEPPGIVCGTDIDIDMLFEPEEPGIPYPFDGLEEKLHGLRKGELVIICAGSGIGKTTASREIVKKLIDEGQTVANVALEDNLKVTAQSLIALDMNIPLGKFRMHPPSSAEAKPSIHKYVDNPNVYYYAHRNGLNDRDLMSTLYSYAKRVDYIVLDHLHMAISQMGAENERRAIDKLMSDLSDLVVETGVGLLMVVHLKRTSGDKSYAHGGEVELTDLRGSAALEQYAWAVVGLERDQQGDDHNFTRIRVLKNRTFGFTGLCDYLFYNPSTGRMENAEEPVELEPMEEALDEA
jgi:twinkle protein